MHENSNEKMLIKFSFSEQATKMCAIVLMGLKFTYLVNVKTIRTIGQIFVAFSEKLNFTVKIDDFLCFIHRSATRSKLPERNWVLK